MFYRGVSECPDCSQNPSVIVAFWGFLPVKILRPWPLSRLSAFCCDDGSPLLPASLGFVGFLMSIQGVQKDLTFPLGNRQTLLFRQHETRKAFEAMNEDIFIFQYVALRTVRTSSKMVVVAVPPGNISTDIQDLFSKPSWLCSAVMHEKDI